MPRKFFIEFSNSDDDLQRGLAEIAAEYPKRFSATKNRAVRLIFKKEPSGRSGLSVSRSRGACTIVYCRKCEAFRALGRLLGERNREEFSRPFAESAHFDNLGVMIDVSRNGVLKVASAKSFFRRCALMGLNMAMLYSEDTYEVPGEPFFGYLRGRYTFDEMKEMDDCADALGIEMFPCIQTLGHLEQILQWQAYSGYRDTPGILLAGDEKTYALLDKMIAAASAPFRSKRIHLGMDEAHGVGTGKYRKFHGERPAFEIFNEHLARVRDLCGKRGLRPMIWSDMFFCLGSKKNEYYDPETRIPPEVAEKIPEDLQLIYWDYYHTDQNFYEDWIQRHRALGSDPIMAGGLWTWSHFWAGLPFGLNVTECCMNACKKQKLREVFMTLWGDDGMECDIFSSLPGLQFFAEHGYSDSVNQSLLRANFLGSCNADFDDWVQASDIDSVPSIAEKRQTAVSVGRWLLWQDPLLALMDPFFEGVSLRSHYEQLSDFLAGAARRTPESRRLLFPARLARVLSLKCDLRRNLADAYCSKNLERIKEIVQGDLPALLKALDALWTAHRDLWLAQNKPFGFEVIEKRYGGLLARLESLSSRLKQHFADPSYEIPELAVKLEKISQKPIESMYGVQYGRLSTPSQIR